VALRGNASRRIAEGIGGSNWTDFKEDDLGWPRYQRDTCVTDGFQRCPQIPKAARVGPGIGRFGYPESLLFLLGVLEFLSCIVYLIPRTAVLGAVLMTGYLGGATASNVRIGDPSYILTVTLGVFVWGGLFLRDSRVRALIPLRS
jgi:hypothetical protein